MNGRLISDEDMVGAEHMQTLDLFRMFDGDEGRYAGQYLLLFCILYHIIMAIVDNIDSEIWRYHCKIYLSIAILLEVGSVRFSLLRPTHLSLEIKPRRG